MQNINLVTTRENVKKYHKTARRMRGNSLVPVVIALLIAAIATIAFLTQGEKLIDQNQDTIARNQIMTIIAQYSMLVAQGETTITDALLGTAGSNAYGRSMKLKTGDPKIVEYVTSSDAICKSLETVFNNKYAITAVCDDTKKNILNITFP